jgi:hypothetical protein
MMMIFFQIDDFGSYSRFSMEPVCKKTWSSIVNGTWAVHHVSPEQIECMFKEDFKAGYYYNINNESKNSGTASLPSSSLMPVKRNLPMKWGVADRYVVATSDNNKARADNAGVYDSSDVFSYLPYIGIDQSVEESGHDGTDMPSLCACADE